MAQLPEDFSVLPRNEIDPHTLGEQPLASDAPPREEWPSYTLRDDRWDLENSPPNRLPDEPYRVWLSRQYVHAAYWAQQDEQLAATAGKGPGRPRVYPSIAGETAAERAKRVNREAQARWRKNKGQGESEEKAAAHAKWQALRQQANDLQVAIAQARAEYLALP